MNKNRFSQTIHISVLAVGLILVMLLESCTHGDASIVSSLEAPIILFDQTQVSPTGIRFSWESVQGATGYSVNRYSQKNGVYYAEDAGKTDTQSFSEEHSYLAQVDYYYTVFAVNDTHSPNLKSPESAWVMVLLGTEVLHPISPANEMVCTNLPTFVWQDEPDATYSLQISEDELFANLKLQKSGIPSTPYSLEDVFALSDGDYFWRYAIQKQGSTTGYSDPLPFSIHLSDQPPTITNFTIQSTSPTTTPLVSIVFEAQGNECYDVTSWLLRETPEKPTLSDMTESGLPATYSLSNGTGVKTVYAWVADGFGTICLQSSQQNIYFCDPDELAPTLSKPTDVCEGSNASFSWIYQPELTTLVEWWNGTFWTTPSEILEGTALQGSPTVGSGYKWRIRSYNDVCSGGWVETDPFSVLANPDNPSLVGITDICSGDDATVSWTSTSGYTYDIEFWDGNAWGMPSSRTESTAIKSAITLPEYYKWRIRTHLEPDCVTDWSTSQIFSMVEYPEPPTLSNSTNFCYGEGVWISWDAVVGQTYTVEFWDGSTWYIPTYVYENWALEEYLPAGSSYQFRVQASQNGCNTGWVVSDPMVVQYCPILYVSSTGHDNNFGFYPDQPLKTIQKALGFAKQEGYITGIRVATGVYNENVVVDANIILEGQYEVDFSYRDAALITQIKASATFSAVTFTNGVAASTKFDGFEVVGFSNGTGDNVGNAVECSANARPILTNNTLIGGSNHLGDSCGNALASYGSSATIQNNTLIGGNYTAGNNSGNGLLIENESASHVVENNTIRGGDNALAESGGIHIINSTPMIQSNALIRGGQNAMLGGGIWIETNCNGTIIHNNRIEGGSGGMVYGIVAESDVTISNNVIEGGKGLSSIQSANESILVLVQGNTTNACTIKDNSLIWGKTEGNSSKRTGFKITNASPLFINNTFLDDSTVHPGVSYGIYAEASSNTTIVKPIFRNNEIKVPNSDSSYGILINQVVFGAFIDPTLENNSITVGDSLSLNAYGIALTGNTPQMNTCSGNTIIVGDATQAGQTSMGIWISGCQPNSVTIGPNNSIQAGYGEGGSYGICLEDSKSIVITQNALIASGDNLGVGNSFGIYYNANNPGGSIRENRWIRAGDGNTSVGIYMNLGSPSVVRIDRNYIFGSYGSCSPGSRTGGVGVVNEGDPYLSTNFIHGGCGDISSAGVYVSIPVNTNQVDLYSNTIFAGNSPIFASGVILDQDVHPTFYNNIIFSNTVNTDPVFLSITAEPFIFRNNLLYNFSCHGCSLFKLLMIFYSNADLTNHQLDDGDGSFESDLISLGASAVSGNRTYDAATPLKNVFVNPSLTDDPISSDYHLLTPGTFAPVPMDVGYIPMMAATVSDIDGQKRPDTVSNIFDIGFDERY